MDRLAVWVKLLSLVGAQIFWGVAAGVAAAHILKRPVLSWDGFVLMFFGVVAAAAWTQWSFWELARERLEFYVYIVQGKNKARLTYVKLGGEEHLVPKGCELVIRESEDGKPEVVASMAEPE